MNPVMSNDNGVIRIGTKGRKKFAFGDGEPFSVDVIDVSNRWGAIYVSFQDANGEVPPSKILEVNDACWKFVAELTCSPMISKAEALEFMKHITDLAQEMKDFFLPKSADEPSLPESLPTHRFSS